MQTPEQEKQIEQFNCDLAKFIENQKPENYSVLLFGGTVTENDDEKKTSSINVMAIVNGKGKAINEILISTMEKDPDVEKILTRAVDSHRSTSIFEKLQSMCK